MDKDQILQSIIADPQLTDPSIDTSGLRTTTPTRTELLANVPEFSGLKFDPTQRSYIEDLYSVYGGGLPTIPEPVVEDTAQIPGAIDTLVNVGGGGGQDQVTGDSVLDTTPTNTQFEQNLLNQGIGVQGAVGDPVVAPGEMPLTQDDFDSFNEIAVTPNLDDIDLGNPLNDPRVVSEEQGLVGGIPDRNRGMIGQTTNVVDDIDLGNPTGDPRVVSEEFGLVGTPSYIDPIMDPNLMSIRQQQTLEAQDLDAQGNLLQSGIDKIKSVIPDFDPIKFTAKAALNTLVGKPISLIFDLLPSEDPASTLNRSIVDELKTEKDYGFNMQSGNLNQDPFGRNPVSAFGDYEQTLLDDAVSTSTTKMGLAKKEFAQDYFDKKAGKTAPQEDIGAVSGDTTTGADPTTGDLPGGGNIADEFGSDGDTGRTTGPTVSRSDPDFGQFGRQQSATAAGGGSSSGGGKIVCTMMNESYGFGSFRNKIWLRHSKDLAPEYQKGYHKIFLPLVKLSKKNIILKKVLEHIAVHRTIDIRQESRGKVHLLGRVYRKILEPICYLVGKYAKR